MINKRDNRLNLNDDDDDNHIQRQWRPIDGVGEISYEQFIGNYMIDSHKSLGYFLYNYFFCTNFIWHQ